jgi:3-oxoacyl-ACP reductase-like protein
MQHQVRSVKVTRGQVVAGVVRGTGSNRWEVRMGQEDHVLSGLVRHVHMEQGRVRRGQLGSDVDWFRSE